VAAYKTGSGELTHLPMQRHIARKGKPMIVSTGMSTPEEIDRTVQTIRAEATPFALMHCTSTYPTPYEHVQLGCIPWLKGLYRVPVGFSDHTLGNFAAFAAVANGAQLFEKHFTVSRSLPGPDQQGSMEPKELEVLVRGIRAIEQSQGGTKKIQPGEQDVRNMALHSVVSIRDVPAGATIGPDDVWAKRPGTGIPARQLAEAIDTGQGAGSFALWSGEVRPLHDRAIRFGRAGIRFGLGRADFGACFVLERFDLPGFFLFLAALLLGFVIQTLLLDGHPRAMHLGAQRGVDRGLFGLLPGLGGFAVLVLGEVALGQRFP